jgi:O-antigen/teichoic acid export membrane protein
MTTLLNPTRQRHSRQIRSTTRSPSGLPWVVSAEAVAAAVGFVSLIWQARRLGPESFSSVEWAAAVAAWLLVLVRGGFDVIVYREAARRPRLIGPLTDLLVGLRLLAALAGYCVVLTLAALLGPDKGAVIAVAGLGLFAAAFVVDVGPRAEGRLGWIAYAQVIRALGGAGAVFLLVRGPADALAAAWCLVAAEACAAVVPLGLHIREYGLPRPRFRWRATRVLAARGMVAGLSRFGRVTLYAADLLILGWWAGAEVGAYAAGKRVVFVLVAMGLVIPSVLGPSIAASWAAGVEPARRRIGAALGLLWATSLPASVGVALTAGRWMPLLFGEAYRDGGPWLALIASRLPFVLAAGFAPAALLACRREGWGLRLVAGQCVLAVVVLPMAVAYGGPLGAGWAAFGIEAAGAVVGWAWLRQLGVAPSWSEQVARPLLGCLGLFAAVSVSRHAPLAVVVAAGAFGYLAAWRFAARVGWGCALGERESFA